MKTYEISYLDENNNDVTERLTEDQILETYWDYWCKRMYEAGKDPEVHTFQNCIDDWIVVHWAVEVKKETK
jgi:hypothetical protein